MLRKLWKAVRSEKMKDNKRFKVLIKVTQRIYHKNPEIQKVIDTPDISMRISFFFAFVFIIIAVLQSSEHTSV